MRIAASAAMATIRLSLSFALLRTFDVAQTISISCEQPNLCEAASPRPSSQLFLDLATSSVCAPAMGQTLVIEFRFLLTNGGGSSLDNLLEACEYGTAKPQDGCPCMTLGSR